jgi:hypothetical protein
VCGTGLLCGHPSLLLAHAVSAGTSPLCSSLLLHVHHVSICWQGVTAVPADADVNRAVALPAAPHLVATCSDSPAVALLQLDAALEGQPPEAYAATCELSAGSFALAWHPSPDVPASSALLLSGDVQGNLVLLDAHLSKQQVGSGGQPLAAGAACWAACLNRTE